MNPIFAARLGASAGTWLRRERGAAAGSVVVLGRDTRGSGPELEAAVANGLRAAGLHPVSAGVVPTPAVAMGVRAERAAGGVAITASHNPAEDNGIKFFNEDGLKLSDEDEVLIESILETEWGLAPSTVPGPVEQRALGAAFVERALSVLPAGALKGWNIALDAANGAASQTSFETLSRLGANVRAIGVSPDGRNINAGVGSQHPEKLQALASEHQARVGIAHDGDADRVVLVDEKGQVVDGDELLAILGVHALRTKRLPHHTLVSTIQSNLGLDAALRAAGGRVERTNVGDRYVAEAMLRGGFAIGGENSGHVICSEFSMSGDGLLAALLTLRVMIETGKPLSELRGWMKRFPQATLNLKVAEKKPLETLPATSATLAALERELAGRGRLLVRYSGTESKLRLLVESDSDAVNAEALARLKAVLSKELRVL